MKRRQTVSGEECLALLKKLEGVLGSEYAQELQLIRTLQQQKAILETQNAELCQNYQELEASRNRLSDLYNQAPVGYLTFDSKGTIVEINPMAASMLSATPSQLAGRLFTPYLIHSELETFFQHLFQSRIVKGRSVIQEFSLLVGQQIIIAQCISTMVIQNEIEQYRTILIDITEQKRLQAAIRQEILQERELLETNTRKEQKELKQTYERIRKRAMVLQNEIKDQEYRSRLELSKSRQTAATIAGHTIQLKEDLGRNWQTLNTTLQFNALIAAQNERLSQELDQNTKELNSMALRVVEKYEQFQILEKKLKEALYSSSSKSKKLIKELLQEVQKSQHAQKEWQTFERQLGNVHQAFLQTIASRYPTLSPVEIKIACFLRINLITKEIAQLLHLSEKTIENHRYRIRKKMDIPAEVSLATFITSL